MYAYTQQATRQRSTTRAPEKTKMMGLMLSTSQHTVSRLWSSPSGAPAHRTLLLITLPAGHVLLTLVRDPHTTPAHMESSPAACGGARIVCGIPHRVVDEHCGT